MLFLDTETGGLDPRSHSLLSLGLVVGDGPRVANSLEILVRHEPYVVSAGGLKVNRIDLVRHSEAALDPPMALNVLDVFLDQHFPHRCQPIVLAGHNVGFDQAFLGAFLAGQGRALEPRFSHRVVDTHSLAAGLREAGRLPLDDLNSTALFAHFGIQVPEDQRHTALGDALATFELYWNLVGLMR
ncbi:MAG: 3'-5' exonuclease [Holophaga sp.]|nr:3'-5' exonuclease [Holophaga sp.]